MADTFTNDLRLRLQESGANSGQWGTLLNTTISNIASAFSLGSEAIPNASTHTITLADGTADEARSMYLKCTGGGQACTVTLAPNTISKVWIISNETSATLTFSQGSGANVAIAAGAVKVIVTDGAGSGAAVVDALSGLSANVSDLTTTGNISFGDNDKAIFGAGSDLEILSNGTDGLIRNGNATGEIRMESDDRIIISDRGFNEVFAVFNDDDDVKLYHNGSQRLATTSSGLNVTGTVTADGLTVDTTTLVVDATNNRVGIGVSSPAQALHVSTAASTILNESTSSWSFLRLKSPSANGGYIQFADADDDDVGQIFYYHGSGGDYMSFTTNASEAMRIDASGNLLVGKTVTSLLTAGIALNSNGAIYATVDAERPLILNRETSDGSIAEFRKDNTAVGSIGSEGGDLVVGTGNVGMRFFDAFNAIIPRISGGGGNDASIDIGLVSGGNNFRFKDLYLSGTINLGTKITATGVTTTANAWKSTSNSTSSSKHMLFANPNGNVGDIRTNGSATAYITSSDYRLKENVVAMSGATERLKQLKPSRFNFIADADTTVDGFLAHEVQDIVPEAIAGEKDAMVDEEYEVTPAVYDDDGNVVTEAVMGTRSVPDYQGIDQSKLVPLLVATIQELEARITQLENN